MQYHLESVANGQPLSSHTRLSGTSAKGRVCGRPLIQEIEELVTPRPESSYLFRIGGHFWADQGLLDGDIAVIDRKQPPEANDLVVSWHDEGFGMCRFWQLLPGDEALGVVTAIIHPLHRGHSSLAT